MSCHVSRQSLRLFFCRPCTLAVGPIPPDVEKNSMLHFSDMLVICSFLLLLIFLVLLTGGSILVTLRKGAEHPYVKKMLSSGLFPRSCQLQCLDGPHPPCFLILV